MADVAISQAPSGKPKSLAISRDGNKYTAKWSLPTNAKSTSNKGRWEHQRVIDYAVRTKGATKLYDKGGVSLSTLSRNQTITRADYYPVTKKKLASIRFKVAGENDFGGKTYYGDYAEADFKISTPKAPTLSAIEVNNGTLSTVLKAPDSTNSHHERHWVTYTVTMETNRAAAAKKKVVKDPVNVTGTGSIDRTISVNEPDWQNFASVDEYIKYTVEAVSKGLAGDSKKVKRSIYLAYADKPTITGIDVTDDFVRVRVTPHPDKTTAAQRPIKTLQLQVGYSDSKVVTSWQDVDGATDDDKCTALSCSRGVLTPGIGDHVYFRVKATWLGESTSMVSEQVEAEELYIAPSGSSTSSDVKVDSAQSGVDGTSIIVKVGWKSDDFNMTTVSWSKDPDAWRSTDEPSTFDMPDATWSDGPTVEYTGGTSSVKVAKLDEATVYYVRARRGNTNDVDNHGGWSVQASAATGAPVSGVSATAPDVVARGDEIPVTWVVSGAEQRKWGVKVNGGEVASGDGMTTYYAIPASSVEGVEEAVVTVTAYGDSDVMESDPVSVRIADRPTASIASNETVTALPHTFTVTAEADVTVRLTAGGVAASRPDGISYQTSGEVVWSDNVAVSGTSTLAIPAGVELVDGAEYTLTATPYADTLTGEAASVLLAVEWAHQAVAPQECEITLDVEAMSATVSPAAPQGAAPTDTYNLYRVTANGVYMVAEGVAFGTSVTDLWAPYGVDVAYRVATVTADGDMDWMDFPYTLDSNLMRIDWPGGYVELPYDLNISEQYAKDAEVVTYMDGTTLGYWNEGAKHTANLGANTVKATPAVVPALAELGRYAGSAFVRTPMGHAYEADVQVSGIDASASSATVGIGITASEVRNGDFPAVVGTAAEVGE